MLIDRVLFPIEALGPGKRLVIWTVGCSKHCDKCSNRELWYPDVARDIPVDDLIAAIRQMCAEVHIDGVTITGGDPLEQVEELLRLVSGLHAITADILVYTGYTYEELERILSEEEWKKLKENVAVLIDGRYEDDLNTSDCILRGSANQNIIFFQPEYRTAYNEYMEAGRKIQNIYCGDNIISVGIHNKEERNE